MICVSVSSTKPTVTLLVCVNQRLSDQHLSCGQQGAKALLAAIKPLAKTVSLATAPFPCMGMCQQGPNIRIAPGGPVFHQVTIDSLPTVVAEAERFLQAIQQNQ